MRFATLAAVIAIAGCPAMAAHAQVNQRADDTRSIEDCIKTAAPAGTSTDKAESCIGIVSEPCLNDKKATSTSAMTACIARERVVWDDILNETFRRLREKLDDKQKDKLRDMQRAWIASRDASCAFYWDYFQGTMATPMAAECVNRETGRRALFLLGFLTDAENK
jgi:uncharacterized protein YecT (DUF1311 family)